MMSVHQAKVEFFGGPFDGLREVCRYEDHLPRVEIRATFQNANECQLMLLAGFAVYELDESASRYRYVCSLPATRSLRAVRGT